MDNPNSSSSSPISVEDQDPNQTQETTTTTTTTATSKTHNLPLATLALSFSLPPSLFPSPPPKPTSTLSPFPTQIKIRSQLSSLSLYQTHPAPHKKKKHSNNNNSNSITPLQSPFLILPRRPSDPSSSVAARRTSLIWFRCDLRIHDHEPLSSASNSSLSLLPVFLFDPRDFGRSASSGFEKTGAYRAQFIIQSVSDLRSSLRSRGSDLVVRIGKPETVLVELAKAVGADAVYAHREASRAEVMVEERVEKALEEEGVDVNFFWGSTLHHLEDLPFDLEGMPLNYGGFKEKVKGVEVRKTIEAMEEIKGLPTQGDVEVGDIPTLLDLGLNPPPVRQDGKAAVGASLVGGETEALERLQKFAAEYNAQPKTENKNGAGDSIYGTTFSCKISPWLTMGCLSPRFMFEELKRTATRTISAATQKDALGADNGMNWLMFELLWRDFFKFITKKYSSNTKKTEAVPATACTGALA